MIPVLQLDGESFLEFKARQHKYLVEEYRDEPEALALAEAIWLSLKKGVETV